MLREGLRAELPGLVGLPARLRLPAIPMTSPWLAAVSALGVSTLVSALIGTVSSAWFYLSGPYAFQLRNAAATTIVGFALATGFAFGAARWRGVLAAAALIAVLSIEQLWLGLPGRLLFCERTGASCDALGIALMQLWPPALGIAVGAVAAFAAGRWARPGRPGVVTLLLGLGVVSLLVSTARLAIVPFVGRAPTGPAAGYAFDWVIASGGIGAVVLGLIIGIFGARPLLGGLLVVLFYIGPWSPYFFFLRDGPPNRGFVLWMQWREIAPLWSAAAALVAIGGGMLIRRSRIRAHDADGTPEAPSV